MPRLVSFVYCLNSDRQPETGALNAFGIVSKLRPDFVPGGFSFSVVFSILGIDPAASNNTIQVRFACDKTNNVLADTGVITLGSQPENQLEDHIPIEYQGYDMNLDFRNIVFTNSGIYYTEVIFNGQILAKQEIYVEGKNRNE